MKTSNDLSNRQYIYKGVLTIKEYKVNTPMRQPRTDTNTTDLKCTNCNEHMTVFQNNLEDYRDKEHVCGGEFQ